MELGLKNKIALVTASSRGLGKAVAESLAAEGVNLVICSRNSKKIEKTGLEIEKMFKVNVLPVVCDLMDEESVLKLKEKTIENFNKIDILFTNAGGPPPGKAFDFSLTEYRESLELNLLSAINLVLQFIELMKKNQWGRIIISTSISVKQPIETLALSNVSRVGLVSFVKSILEDISRFNITANIIAPGYIMTERVKNLIEDKMKRENISYEKALESITDNIPLKRIGTPEEFGSLVTFLASNLSGFINGETILIDGGMYKGLF